MLLSRQYMLWYATIQVRNRTQRYTHRYERIPLLPSLLTPLLSPLFSPFFSPLFSRLSSLPAARTSEKLVSTVTVNRFSFSPRSTVSHWYAVTIALRHPTLCPPDVSASGSSF